MIISKFTIFLVLIYLIAPIVTENACSTFIYQLEVKKNNSLLQNAEERDYFQYSGVNGQNDLGSKSSCEANPSRRYFGIAQIKPLKPEFHSKSWTETETGICMPDFCNAEFLASDPTLLNQLCKINHWKPKGNLILHDPNADPPRSSAFYILIGIFCVLIFLCLFSTFIQNKIWNEFQDQDQDQARKVKKWLWKSFDLVGNFKSLYATAKESGQSDDLAMFGFLRVISIIQVVGFHCVDHYWRKKKGAWPTLLPWTDEYFHVGHTALAHFFFVGGFLAAFTLASKASKEGVGAKNFFLDVIHRLFKVYPGLWVATLLYWIVLPGLMNGTLWNKYLGAVQVCEERWTQKLFLVENLMQQEAFSCALWTWYIAADFQIYPFVILLAYLFVNKKYPSYYAYSATIIMTFLSIKIGMVMAQDPEINIPSWKMLSPALAFQILIGVFFGFQYYDYSKLKLRSNFNALCEDHAILRYSSIIIGAYLKYYGTFTHFDHTSFTAKEWECIRRLCISLGTALFFVPLANNCSSILKRIMNLRIFQILGKLCFGVYLLHLLFMVAWKYSTETIFKEYNHSFMMQKVFLCAVCSFLAALIYHLILEKPLLNIEAHFTKRQRLQKTTDTDRVHADSTKAYTIAQQEPDHKSPEQPDIEISDVEELVDYEKT